MCWLLVLITSLVSFTHVFAASPQLTLGDKISVFSDKAYRKNQGKYFEAVGNVVIISQKDTVYGEVASLDQESMLVKVEGNVRLITKDMTLYGSHIEYNLATGQAVIKNARILALDFNIVANELIRVSEEEYLAHEAEFTTCRDCTESWSVYGKEIKVKVGNYVQIKNGLAKIKGIDVIYLPYIIFPIQTKRKSGLLFPRISSRLGEGFSFEQPVFVAIDESKDATISPTFWATRGYGGDFQYRQRFRTLSWMEVNTRLLNDTIYLPLENNEGESGENYFRYFVEAETHHQWTPNLVSHLRYTGARDLDIVRDHPTFTDPRILGSDIGLSTFTDWRQDYFSIGYNVEYLRNQLYSDPTEFDRSYVQTLPRVNLSTIPFSVVQTDKPFLQHIVMGLDSSVTRFRQVKEDDTAILRNADRLSVQPYIQWNFFTWGPVSFKSNYVLDQQFYRFEAHREPQYAKNAGQLVSEVSFTMDKVFGLAYQERIPIKYIPEKELEKLRENKEQGLTPIQKTEKENRLIGEMPVFQSALTKDDIIQVQNSYRHSQQFKFLHHYITSQVSYGNDRFEEQIRTNRGWFDFEDAPRDREFLFGTNVTRTIIPPQNTIEFQWNNALIRKTPKVFSYLEDRKYLRDNFTYTKIGYFDISQGYLLQNDEYEDYRERLTRLLVQAGFSKDRWFVGFSEYFFHSESDHIFNLNFTRKFDYLNLFSAYTYNSFSGSELKTLSSGGQIRPTDVLGLAVVNQVDLVAKENIMTTYSLDIMPHNNCWILNFNYRESLVDSRYSMNILFNFGDDKFASYRDNYFGTLRL